ELELMRSERPEGEDFDAAVEAAIGDTDRLATLSEDLLLLARADRDRLPLRREALDVGALLESVAGRYPADRVTIDSAPGGVSPVRIDADRLRLEQALGNLVDNALAHGGAPVTIWAS